MKSLIINLIYVKGSVEKLLPLIGTHLANSSCSYRLISNGCTPEEEEILQNLAAQKEQLLYYSIDSVQILPHHVVLNHLLNLDDDKYFAFMDTDILTISDPVPIFLEKLENHDGFTSGFPVWHDSEDLVMPKNFMVMGGRYAKVHTGDIVGLSYMAIYHRDRLKKFIEFSGIDFKRYKWKDIPAHYQSQLKSWGLKKSYFDTGKLLVLLWNRHDGQVSYSPMNEIIHFGGISGGQHLSKQKKSLFEKILKILPQWVGYYSRYLIFNFRLGIISVEEYADLLKLTTKRKEVYILLHLYQTDKVEELSSYHFEMLSGKKINDLSMILKELYSTAMKLN